MSEVTAPIMTDATGQSIDSKLNSLLGKMDNLAAAFQPNASGIVYSNTTSGLTGDDVQEAIDEMAADVSEIKQSLSDYFGKEFEATASTERDFILNVMVQAYTYLTNNSLPFIFCKVSWTNNNSGYAILSSNRRFQIQIGDSMCLGVLNSAGTALANLRSVTTTAHA